MNYNVLLRQLVKNNHDKWLLCFDGRVIDGKMVEDNTVVSVLTIKDRDEMTGFLSEAIPLFKAANGGPMNVTLGNITITCSYDLACQIFFAIEEWFECYMNEVFLVYEL